MRSIGGLLYFCSMTKHVLIGLILLLGGLLACNNKEEKTGDEESKPTIKKIEEDSTILSDSALKLINKRIVADPNNPELYEERSAHNFQAGRVEEAIKDINMAIDIDSSNADYYFTKGYYYHLTLKLKEAEAAFLLCLKRDENYVDAHVFLAKIYQALARPTDVDKFNYDKAREHINKGLEIDVNRHDLYYLRGMIYEELGDSGAALSSFKTATEVNPDYFDAYVKLGLMYSIKQNPKAEFAFKTALELKPERKEVIFALARFYQDVGKYDLAEQNYKHVVEIDSFYSVAYLNLGYMYMEYDTAYTKAIEYLHRAIFFNVGQYMPMAYTNLAIAYEKTKKFAKARKYYQEAIKYDGDYLPALQGLDALDRKGL